MMDLIGEPYTIDDHDCRWATAEALRRLGHDDAANSLMSVAEIKDASEKWRRLRGNDKHDVGDIVLSINSDGELHLGVKIENDRVLTSTLDTGVFSIREDKLIGKICYYRYIG